MNQLLDLVRASQMLSSDWPPENLTLDTLYIPSLSPAMIAAARIFEMAADLYARKTVRSVSFNGSQGEAGFTPKAAYPGKDWYVARLATAGIMPQDIIPTRHGFHMREEADAFIGLARGKGWQTAGILTLIYRFPQTFCCLVEAMKAAGYFLRLYAISPPRIEWWTGSEGESCAAEAWRHNQMVLEDQSRRHACSFAELFHYLQNRKEITQKQNFSFVQQAT